MVDFCGWVTSGARPGFRSRDGLATMLAARGYTLDQPVLSTTGNAAVAATAVGSGLRFAEDDGVMVVIAGRPRYADAEPSDVARLLTRHWRGQGQKLAEGLAGPFALAIIDAKQQSAFLAVDRIGIGSMAYAVSADALVFGNRVDLVAAHPEVETEIDPQAIFNYIYFTVVPAPGTIFRGVEKLRPAEWVYYRQGQITRGYYWHIRYRDAPRHDLQEQSANFHRILRESVGRAVGTDRVCAFLSGGTDSSTIAGVLSEQQDEPVQTYSIGFDADGFDEMEYVRIAARHFGLDSREYYLTPEDVLRTIPLVASQYDEPFANESAVSAYFCARLAADDGYRVMLGGDGGDEIFGGNERYAKQRVFERYTRVPALLRRAFIEPIADWSGMDANLLTRKLRSYVRQARIPLPERMESYNFVYRQPLSEMFDPDFLDEIDAGVPAALLKEPYDRADTTHYINRMLHLDLKFTLADNDLRKVSKMAEAAGIEVRYPLLDDAMVDFSASVPPAWKVRGQYLRWFFKSALKGYLPERIIAKEKHGFGLPFGLWLREYVPLREYVEDRLSDLARRRWLRPQYIERVRLDHRDQHASYFGKMLWILLMLEEWRVRH